MNMASYETWIIFTLIFVFITCCIIALLDMSEVRKLENRTVATFLRKSIIAQAVIIIFAFTKGAFLEEKRGTWVITGRILMEANGQAVSPKHANVTLTPPLVTIHDDGIFESKVIFEKENGEWKFPSLNISANKYSGKNIHLNKKFLDISGPTSDFELKVDYNKREIMIVTPIELEREKDDYNANKPGLVAQ